MKKRRYMNVLFVYFCLSLCESAWTPSEMCKNDSDCSFQLPSSKREKCQILHTKDCLNFFPNPSQTTGTKQSPTESKFSVSVVPYAAEVHSLQMGIPLSAINISFTIHHKGITGLSILIVDENHNKTMCRILSFEDYGQNLILPMFLFYDCFYNLVEYNIQNVHMTFKALPMNEEISYYVSIPPAKSSETACNWQPLIMVCCPILTSGIVRVKFSQPPQHLNISTYLVELVQSSNNIKLSRRFAADYKLSMMTIEFAGVKRGSYTVIVRSDTYMEDVSYCPGFESGVFQVNVSSIDVMGIVSLCIIIIFSLLALLVVIKLVREFHHKKVFKNRPSLLLVYSSDCPEHQDLMLSFGNYLITQCNMSVTTIYGRFGGNPQEWMKNKYHESDVIIFVISEGLFHTLNPTDSVVIKEHHIWYNQLASAHSYISSKHYNDAAGKKICTVCFPYTNKNFVPDCLDPGEIFMLPREMNLFLCFVFECKPVIPFSKWYPPLRGSNISDSAKGRDMCDKIKTMQLAVQNNSHIEVIQRSSSSDVESIHEHPFESECSKIMDRGSPLCSENSDAGFSADLAELICEWKLDANNCKSGSETEEGDVMDVLIKKEFETKSSPT